MVPLGLFCEPVEPSPSWHLDSTSASDAALRPQRLYWLLKTGSPGRPPRFSHRSRAWRLVFELHVALRPDQGVSRLHILFAVKSHVQRYKPIRIRIEVHANTQPLKTWKCIPYNMYIKVLKQLGKNYVTQNWKIGSDKSKQERSLSVCLSVCLCLSVSVCLCLFS